MGAGDSKSGVAKHIQTLGEVSNSLNKQVVDILMVAGLLKDSAERKRHIEYADKIKCYRESVDWAIQQVTQMQKEDIDAWFRNKHGG